MKIRLNLFSFLFFCSLNVIAQSAENILKAADEMCSQTSYSSALEKYLAALKVAEDEQNQVIIIKAQKGIAKSHYYMRDKTNALKWLHQSLKNIENYKQDSLLADTYYLISLMFIETSTVDSAEYYAYKAADLLQKEKQYEKLSNTLAALSDVHLNGTQDFNKAQTLIKQAETFAAASNDIRAMAFVNMKWYFLYSVLKKDNHAALPYINRAEELYMKVGNYEDKMYAINFKAECLARLGNPMAADYMHKWFSFKDSVFNAEKAASMAKYEKLYEIDKMDKENKILQQENNLNRLKIELKNRLLIIVVVILMLLVLFVLWINNRNNLKKKQQEVLTLQNIQNDKERIARDLHDHVGGQLSYITHAIHGIIDEDKEKRTEIADSIQQSVKSIITSLRETIWAINEANISAEGLSDKLKVYARNLFKHSNTQLNIKENIYTTRELNSLAGLNLYRICQEILNNAFKHAHASEIKIILISTRDRLNLVIEDNGVGFDNNQASKEKYGLNNISKRANEFGIKLFISSKPGKGTRYEMVV